MKRMLALLLCLALLCPMVLAAEPESGAWSRTEPGGRYVTVRLEAPAEAADLDWGEQRLLTVRYADTKEPVPLTSDYYGRENVLFATVPAADADRPLEVFQAPGPSYPDCVRDWGDGPYQAVPIGTHELTARGLICGDGAGNLNRERTMTRAEAAALFARLLSLEPGEDPGYADVPESAWYHDDVAAVYGAGIVSADVCFRPGDPVTRAEFVVMFARALEYVGYLAAPEGETALTLTDAAAIPAWALPAYEAFTAAGVGLASHTGTVTEVPTGQADPMTGEQAFTCRADPGLPMTREGAIECLYFTLRDITWYPTDLAIRWGFDETVPTVDGSTSTYPYTEALFGRLFHNYRRHPDFPAAHSKSYASYERLIAGEVDALFAATPPSADLVAQAEKAGVKLESVPIAYDAMVFFTNGANKVDGLTRQQIQDIYVYGRYDNWKELGGDDAALLPYRRNVDSGSHALMEQYFLEGGKLSLSPDVHNVLTSYAMSSALTDVADAMTTDPPAYAIGYSVYYYYNNNLILMFGDNSTLKLLAVDGVYPNEKTIADGSYPLAGYNYVVYRADAPQDSPARQLADFLLTREGQQIVASAGFGPVLSDPKGDLEIQLPGWTVEAVWQAPAGDSYTAISRNADGTLLRGSWLRRGTVWGEFLLSDCPVPEAGKLSAGRLQWVDSFVFGMVGAGGPYTVRLTDDQGLVQTAEVPGGGYFHFFTEGEPVTLELLRNGQVIDTCTDFST